MGFEQFPFKKHVAKKIIEAILPLVHVWGMLLFLHSCMVMKYTVGTRLPSAVLWILVVPVILLEILMSKHYDKMDTLSRRNLTVVSLRLIFWILLFLLVIRAPYHPKFSFIAKIPGILILFGKYIIYDAMREKCRLISYLILIFCTPYYIFVIRKKLFRLTFSFILPLMFAFIFFHSYYYDTKCHNLKEIIKQKNVSVVFELKTLKDWARRQYVQRNWRYRDYWARTRQIQVEDDGNVIYAAYGVIRDKYSYNIPCFFKLNANTGEIQAIFKRLVRAFIIDSKSRKAYIGLWSPGEILVVDKYNLKEMSSMDFRPEVNYKQLNTFYFDSEKDIIYVGMHGATKIVKYDLKSKKILGSLKLNGKEDIDIGRFAAIWKMKYFSNIDKLYLLVFSGNYTIIELAPEELRITKSIKLPGEGSAIGFDRRRNTILVPGFSDNRMWEIDISTFKIVETYTIPFGCRHIYVDPQGDRVYLLSYVSGKLLVFSRNSGRIEREYLVGEKPDGLFVLGDYLYTSSNAGIIRIKYR